MDCIGTINVTITVPFTLDVHSLWFQLANFSRLLSKLGRGRGRHVVKTAVEREH